MVQNWEVIVMKSDCEPWWFFEDWRNSIIESTDFSDQELAIDYYHSLYKSMSNKYTHVKVKKSSMAAFWDEDDFLFCEHCDDDLQTYYGLLIMLNDEPYIFQDQAD